MLDRWLVEDPSRRPPVGVGENAILNLALDLLGQAPESPAHPEDPAIAAGRHLADARLCLRGAAERAATPAERRRMLMVQALLAEADETLRRR